MSSACQAPGVSSGNNWGIVSRVPRVPRVLDEEFEAQLDSLGLKPTGKHTPIDKMRRQDAFARTRRRAEAILARVIRMIDNVVCRELTAKDGKKSPLGRSDQA